MKEVMLNADVRDLSTKHTLKVLRKGGKVPAVYYGHHEKPMSLAIEAKLFDEIVKKDGANALINLKMKDESKTAIVKQIQRDCISQKAIHVDFQAVSLKEMIVVNVPLHIEGVAPGVKNSGGILEHILREISVRCLPTDIPHNIIVDISSLELNHSITVKDLARIDGVEFLSDENSIIVNVVVPAAEEVAATPAEGAVAAATPGSTAEPEVISKGKKEKEEGAAAPAAGDKKAESSKK
ncbi:MAG: 50S ribosomal protein L25 [Endomicrobiales bacterium]